MHTHTHIHTHTHTFQSIWVLMYIRSTNENVGDINVVYRVWHFCSSMYGLGLLVVYRKREMWQYSGNCLRWSLCKAATSLKQPASLAPDSTKALESTSAEQPPLYNGQLELHGLQAVVLARFHCTCKRPQFALQNVACFFKVLIVVTSVSVLGITWKSGVVVDYAWLTNSECHFSQ